MDLPLSETFELKNCGCCSSKTSTKVNCCEQYLCKICYEEWLKRKRQCMFCREDQMSFDSWVENWRVEDNNGETIPSELSPRGLSINALMAMIRPIVTRRKAKHNVNKILESTSISLKSLDGLLRTNYAQSINNMIIKSDESENMVIAGAFSWS